MTNEEKARAAASQWCRCHKCDGIAHNLISESLGEVTFKCDKDKLQTCHTWYDGYRTALMALGMEEPINEEELDKLAKEYEENYPLDDSHYSYYCYDGFKAGYRKAKEE